MGFGKLLEEKMNQKGIKQAELAKAVGLPKTTLSSMILRDNTKIEIEKFLQICAYLDCDPEEFYNEFRQQNKRNIPPSFTQKYYAIDDFGRDIINIILEKEYERCTGQEQLSKQMQTQVQTQKQLQEHAQIQNQSRQD